MKRIDAYIRPVMADIVVDNLREHKIHGLSLFHGRGFGQHVEGKTPHYLDSNVHFGYAELVKIEIICTDEMVPAIVDCLLESAHTGRHGDGKIFVSPLDAGWDIRTKSTGENII